MSITYNQQKLEKWDNVYHSLLNSDEIKSKLRLSRHDYIMDEVIKMTSNNNVKIKNGEPSNIYIFNGLFNPIFYKGNDIIKLPSPSSPEKEIKYGFYLLQDRIVIFTPKYYKEYSLRCIIKNSDIWVKFNYGKMGIDYEYLMIQIINKQTDTSITYISEMQRQTTYKKFGFGREFLFKNLSMREQK